MVSRQSTYLNCCTTRNREHRQDSRFLYKCVDFLLLVNTVYMRIFDADIYIYAQTEIAPEEKTGKISDNFYEKE